MFLDKNKIKDKFPFISVVAGANVEYMGVILGSNKNTISFIDISKIRSEHEFASLIQICQNWWWYSNRTIPINLYYYDETQHFMKYVTHLPTKAHEVISGHVASLDKIVADNKSSIKTRTLRFPD